MVVRHSFSEGGSLRAPLSTAMEREAFERAIAASLPANITSQADYLRAGRRHCARRLLFCAIRHSLLMRERLSGATTPSSSLEGS
jgi:hypothetical protein